jgi:hypothetical protein
MHARRCLECPECGNTDEPVEFATVYQCARCDGIYDLEEEAEGCCPDAPTEE